MSHMLAFSRYNMYNENMYHARGEIMNLDYIREFVVLTQVGKYQKAADILFLSQSALSKHIMALEKELGADLFIRSKKQKQVLTPFGKSFLPYALQLNSIYSEMDSGLLQLADGNPPKITIGTSPLVTLYTVFAFLDEFLQKFPDIRIEIIDASQDMLYELLRAGSCDLIIVQESKQMPENEFKKILYAQDKLVVILPKDHPLACKNAAAFEEIASERFIQTSQSLLSNISDELSGLAGFDIQAQITVGRPSDVIDMIEHHIGVSIMPSFPAHHFSNGKVAIVDLEPVVPVTFQALYPKDRNLPAPTRAMLNMLPGKTLQG